MKFNVAINWRLAAFTVFFLIVFINLGFWQLNRADEKARVNDDRLLKMASGPLPFSEVVSVTDAQAVSGLPVVVQGQYDDASLFLLDNRIVDGVVGFEVLVPFVFEGAQLSILVNRGFVPMGRTRSDVPVVPALQPVDELSGTIYVRESGIPLQAVPFVQNQDLYVIQSPDIAGVELIIGHDLYEHVIRLDNNDPNALPRHWPLSNMTPEKHVGYAIQWFVMSAVLASLFLYFTFSNHLKRQQGES